MESEIIQKLKDKKLSNSSINAYLSNLRNLNNGIIKNLNFLNKPDVILSKIEHLKDNTQKSYLIGICSVLNLFEKYKKLYLKYFDLMKLKSSEIRKIPSDKMSETQKDNWITYDDILNKYDELKKNVKLFNKKNLNENQYNTLLQYVILSLYVLIPPRRNKDYILLNVVKNYNDSLDNDYNYLDLTNNKLIFNKYKTAKSTGQQTITFDDDLKDAINTYLKYRLPLTNSKINNKLNVPFLIYFDTKPFYNKINSITLILNKIFNKKIGSSMIRHIFVSYKNDDYIKDQKKVSDLMAHSVNMNNQYYKDIDQISNNSN
jgi:integrase